ncbi:MAG: hypothetical protein JWP44_3494, partial [Mucilaginibacter sp.]|nr:hypothetical protein [Mucilaginibacter sp.]
KKHYDDANEEVAKKKAEAKQDADDKKREAKNESKGFWGWLADKASALIDGLKKAVSFIFNKLRAAVKWAFDKAKKLAMMAIEFARNVVVGLIKAFGEALKVLVDIAFAAFPEIRDKINGKIDQAVNKAVSVANQAFDKFKEVVAAVIDAFAAFADAALAIVQKSIDIALSVTEFVIVASLKIIGFLSDIERQYNLFKGMIDDLLYLWDNPQVVEDKAHEFLAPYIENVPENAKSEIKKALDAVGLGAEKHFTGIMKYLMPALINLKTNWWQQAKDMVWFLIWPFGKGSPLREDGPKLWTLLPQIWNDFKAGEYSRVIDGGLEWMQALNSVVGSFAGWFVIGGALIGGILGAIFGVGAGALPGAGAGFEAGVAIGEGIMASMLATEGLVIVKAVYDLSVTADDGVESPIPEKKIEKPDDSQTKNEAPSTEGNIAGNGPVGPEKKDDAPRQYTSGEVKTGHDRIQYAYQRIATSGLTLGIMLAFILLGAIGGKIAKAIVSGIKWVGKIIGELAPELTEGVKGIAKGITESKPVQAIKGAVKGVSESKAGQKIKAGLAKFNKGRAGMKKKISSFKKKFGLGEPEKPTASKPGEKSADNTNINEPKDNVTGRTDTEPVKPGEKPVDPEKTIDKGGDHEKIEIPETGKTANSPVDAEPSGKAPVSGSDIEDLPPGSVMMGDSMNEVDAAKMYRNSIKETPGREVGIYHNPETNEFIIIQGDEGAVYVEGPGGAKEGPTGGRAQKWKEILDGQDAGSWDLVSHYHPADEGGFVSSVNRLPSGAGGDFGVLMDESANVGNKSRTSKIDFKTPRGDEFTFFSYEPGEAKPYKIDYPDSVSLKREKLEFGTLQEYHAWMMEKYNVDLGPVTESVSATGNQPVSPSGTPSAAKRKVGKGITADEPVPAEAKKATGPGDNEPGIKPDHVTDVSEPLVDENASSEHGSDEHTNNGNAEPENEVNKDEQPKKRLSSERRNEIRENAKKKLKELEKRKVKNQKKIDKLGDQLHDARANVNRLKEKVLNSHAGSKEYKSALKEWRKANEKLAKIIEDDELAGYWEERRKQGEAENAILASLELKRPSLREPTIKAIRDAADKTPDGKFFLDANTKEIIQGEPHYGHIHGKENRRLILEASEKGMTQEQFNDWVNSHPEWFQTETPANNISHRFEKPGID